MAQLLAGFFASVVDFITGIFALIPQFMFFFYTCFASLLDLLQFVLRKLAGLDNYYINGTEVNDSDILEILINSVFGIGDRYSALSTVFWSLVIFGAIVLILGLIISLIKSHYSYDAKKSRPSVILGKGLKSIALFAMVPFVTIFGIMISNVLLRALDSITATSSSGVTAEVFESSSSSPEQAFVKGTDEWGNATYVSYDFFGAHAPTGNITFSGTMFKAAAYNANRVRYGGFTASRAGEAWSDCGVFNSDLSGDDQVEAVANMIDYAFANNLTLNERTTASVLKAESAVLISSFKYWQSRVWYLGTINFNNFSKYNVGLVWYYYNLWSFNFLIGFCGILIGVVLLFNIVFGLVVRLFEATALMLILGPIVALGPLDDGKSFKEWRTNFVGDVLMAYGAIVGMNLLFMILPHLNKISFFTSPMLNSIMSMIIIIVGLLSVKQLIGIIANFTGGKDAYTVGKEAKEESTKALLPSATKVTAVVMLGAKALKFVPGAQVIAKTAEKVATKVHQRAVRKATAKAIEKGNAKVMRSTHEAIRKNQLDELEKQKEELKENQRAERNAIHELRNQANQTDGDAFGKEQEGQKEAEKSVEESKKFEDYLKGLTSSYDAEDEDKDLVEDIRKEIEKAKNKFDASEKTSADADELNNAIENGVERFKYQNSHQIKSLNAYNEAATKRSEARRLNDEADNREKALDDEVSALDKKAEDIRNADVLPGYTIRKTPSAPSIKNTASKVVQFSGQTIKATKAFLGVDDLIKNNSAAVDNMKLALRDFAQAMGVAGAGNIKSLMTSKEKDDAKTSEIQAKASAYVNVKEDREVLGAVMELEKTFKDYKIRHPKT